MTVVKSLIFSNFQKVISLDAKDVPRELTAYIGRPDISTFEITITNVVEGAYSFDMADLYSQVGFFSF